MSATPVRNNTGSSAARRLRALQARTDDPVLADAIDELAALEDRLLYNEAAICEICARVGIDPHTLPDPLRPRLYVPPADVEVPE